MAYMQIPTRSRKIFEMLVPRTVNEVWLIGGTFSSFFLHNHNSPLTDPLKKIHNFVCRIHSDHQIVSSDGNNLK